MENSDWENPAENVLLCFRVFPAEAESAELPRNQPVLKQFPPKSAVFGRPIFWEKKSVTSEVNHLEYICFCRFSCIHTVFEFIMS